jgi:membrane-bound metal-dependent hydrolase YbcI (DUF457 family)
MVRAILYSEYQQILYRTLLITGLEPDIEVSGSVFSSGFSDVLGYLSSSALSYLITHISK